MVLLDPYLSDMQHIGLLHIQAAAADPVAQRKQSRWKQVVEKTS
jgi:hypothetical protein